MRAFTQDRDKNIQFISKITCSSFPFHNVDVALSQTKLPKNIRKLK